MKYLLPMQATEHQRMIRELGRASPVMEVQMRANANLAEGLTRSDSDTWSSPNGIFTGNAEHPRL
jgi:hypothetical protein